MLHILNLHEARFECTFGRGCDGICCRNGRPPLEPDDMGRIDTVLARTLPLLRPAARELIQRGGIVSRRRRFGLPLVRVVAGWCVFFHGGCVLHQLGVADGQQFAYKPLACALFPLEADQVGQWYVRQRGYRREKWDLFCLDPAISRVPARESLRDEIALALRVTAETGAG